ncbi:hypothetical protein B0O80DRAFT_174170 [Mortierella sp. GBAus27b]|nr:hypothetical protein B0O80DRAFT_174170 [Mortierella sp. GBAus27b]
MACHPARWSRNRKVLAVPTNGRPSPFPLFRLFAFSFLCFRFPLTPMAPTDTFVVFASIARESRLLWMSPTGYDILGYEPEEVIGKSTNKIISPDDQADMVAFRKEYYKNDHMGSQTAVRLTRKDGVVLSFVLFGSLCYDFAVAILTILDPGIETSHQRRIHSTTINRKTGFKREFERMKRHHQAFTGNSWDWQEMETEARVCLIINRFTRNLTIMYASSACEKVLHVDPDEITGKPVLLYIRSDDMGPFVEQVDLVKESTTVSLIRFWFQSPNWPQEIPCEGIIVGTTDGIVAVVRKCKPFVRKRFIWSREHFERLSQGSSGSCGSSLGSEVSSSHSFQSFGSFGSSFRGSPQNVSADTLRGIRIVDHGEKELPSHISTSRNDKKLVSENTTASRPLAYQEVVVQDYYEARDDGDDDGIDMVVRGMPFSKPDDSG